MSKIEKLGIIFVVLFALFFSLFGKDNKTSVSFLDIRDNKQAFAYPGALFIESPDFCLIGQSSLMANSPPTTFSPQVLGGLIGTEAQSDTSKEIREYIVQQGDTLSGIADNFGITLNTLYWANDLKNSIIRPGQKLVILPVSGVLHLVKKDETLSGIAKLYKADIKEIAAFNEISEDKIFIGDILIIPDGEMPPKPKSYYASTVLPDSYFMFPTVGRISQGLHYFNAIDIANKCGTSIHAVAEGIVQKAGWVNSVGGNRVRILHPTIGIATYYGHLLKIVVKPGQPVDKGDIIGYMGRTGKATGCHLHFDVRGAANPLAKYPVGSYINF